MNNSPGMNIFERKTYLNKPIENLFLCELLILIHSSFNVVTQITYLAVLHDDNLLL